MVKNNPNIYDNLIPVLWESISLALSKCMEYKELNQLDQLTESNHELINCFSELKKVNVDRHISEGLIPTHQDRYDVFPRVLKLTLMAFNEAQNVPTKSGYVLPSPLYIIYQTFTVPEHSFTAAYAITSCRSFLFSLFNMRPTNQGYDKDLAEKRLFSETDVSDSLFDFETFENLQLRWPKEKFKSNKKLRKGEIKHFVGHFLAAKGIAHLWFGKVTEKTEEGKREVKQTSKEVALEFLSFKKRSKFENQLINKLSKVHFRRSSNYREIPEWGGILNQIFGFPVPIKGSDIVFYGGLRPSSNGGLVVSVSGRAGVGKTSFALAIANSFSAYGTQCFYISLEEEIKDIERRLLSVRPHIQKELSFFSKKPDWFHGKKIPGIIQIDRFSEELMMMAEDLKDVSSRDTSILPDFCPYIIIIDNITELVADFESDHYAQIEEFVDRCRDLNALVILLSPVDIPEKLKLEYLVDIGIELKYKNLDVEDEKPVRVFNLYKTRHQLSRQGSHIFHMSGTDGFRISPQIPSQIDRKEKIQRKLHDRSRIIHTMNYLKNSDGNTFDSTINRLSSYDPETNTERKEYIQLFPRTHILVHGYGSAGKAGFAIKLLLTPPVSSGTSIEDVQKQEFDHLKFKRKILIISFLYPKNYYEELVRGKKNVQGKISNLFDQLPDPLIDYLILYPGYLSPQDFLNKVTRKLDEANLKGQPYTGVLVDGLHNVFLQFEKLQDSNMVWPMLYNILARYNLTIVSTFTNFSLNDKMIENGYNDKNQLMHQAVPDQLLLQKGMAPFLHALVKAADYYLFMEQSTSALDGSKRYILTVKGAIGQAVPEEFLEWDRENNDFMGIHTLSELKELLGWNGKD